MTRNAVPWKAVKILKTKKLAKFGASAVPILKPVNSVALATDTYIVHVSLCSLSSELNHLPISVHIYSHTVHKSTDSAP
jgi:hypothetical protein